MSTETPLDLKKTVNLPKTAFGQKANLAQSEPARLKNQTRDFQRLGILGEWNHPYLTMSNHYEAETARLFGRFLERGYVYKGARPVYWCIHDQTALAEAEVEYQQHTSPSVYVKFPLSSDPALIDEKLAGRKVFLLIWQ